MKEIVCLEELNFSKIYGVVFIPKQIKGYIQFICDMYDNISRYEEIMEKLSYKGYLVFGCDLPGHGKSIGMLGDLEGATNNDLTDIIHKYYQKILRKFPPDLDCVAMENTYGKNIQLTKPVLHAFIAIGFGCSLARSYLIRYHDVNTLVFIGDMCMASRYAKLLKKCQKEITANGEQASSRNIRDELQKKWIDSSGLMKKYERNTYRSVDYHKVRNYEKDSNLNFEYNLVSMQTILSVLSEVTMSQWLSMFPKYLPLYEVCGYLDPVCNYTRETDELLTRFRYSSCKNVFYRYYEHSRHDLLFESCHKEVMDDITKFIQKIYDNLLLTYESQKKIILSRKEGK